MPRNIQINEQMRAESRRKILASASTLFSRQGYFNVRIAEIARRAEMSPGNIYWYFDSKEDILKAILKDYFEAFEAMLIQAETFPGDASQKLHQLINLQIGILEEYAKHTNIYMSILGHGGPVFLKNLGFDTVALGMDFHRHLQNVFESAVQEGYLAAQGLQARVVMYFSFFNGLLSTYAEDWKQLISSEEITQGVLRLIGFQPEGPSAPSE